MNFALVLFNKFKNYGFINYLIRTFRVYEYNKKNTLFKKNGVNVLIQAKLALDEIGIHYWLDFGTLLGVVRNGELIEHDLDIDIGIFLSDYSSSIELAMFSRGFKLVQEYVIDEKNYGLEQTYELNGVSLDIFYYTVGKDYMWCHCFTNFKDLSHSDSIKIKGGLLPIEEYLPIVKFHNINVFNHLFPIPLESSHYLSFHYGGDFMIPRKWNYLDLINDNINSIYLPDKVGVFKSYK